MRCHHNRVDLIVDNIDISLALAEYLQRRPQVDDFNEISYDRAYEVADEMCGFTSRGVSGTLIDVERTSYSAPSIASRWAKRRRSFRTLVGEYDGGANARRAHEDYMTSLLRPQGYRCDCPLVYAGGDFGFPRIREELLHQAERRNVTIIGISDLHRFSTNELERFDSTYELFEIEAAPPSRYEKRTESRSAGRETAKETSRALAAKVENDEQRVASRRSSSQSRINTSDSSKGEPQSQRQLTSAQPHSELFDPSLPLVVLIDSENIDGHIHDFHNPTGSEGIELDRDIRMSWTKLRDWIDDTFGLDSALVAPFFAYSESEKGHRERVKGFTSFLQRNGYRPRAFTREEDRPVVDEAIDSVLHCLTRFSANVLLLSHDGDFLRLLKKLGESEGQARHRIVLAGFLEHMSSAYDGRDWLKLLDIEHDMKLFRYRLPNRDVNRRNRRDSDSIDDFDAEAFLAASGLFPQLKELGDGA